MPRLSFVWEKLTEFESNDLIERYINRRNERKGSHSRHVNKISSNIIQGKEYFRIAKDASISVKPLLLYYGASALTRVVILASNPHISESALKPAHGLETNDWQRHLSTGDFKNLPITIRQGTFYDLLQYTNNEWKFKSSTFGQADVQYRFDIPQVGSFFTLGDLLQTIPNLSEVYETWTQEPLSRMEVKEVKNLGDNGVQIEMLKWYGTVDFNSLLPPSILIENVSEYRSGTFKAIYRSDWDPQFSYGSFDAFDTAMSSLFITKPMNDSVRLSPIAQCYALSYFFGMLSRYYPTKWMGLKKTGKGDSINPLVNKVITLIEQQFPELVYQKLFE